ncbi:hypothetical protein CIT292_08519 [Citrobacter youngae ATCC 29220]|uniref:Uncharacterized protein n=1 Tax=Citrobacter youngae ATCC 29220 TaxID=500640 RepID=D4BDF2_9ENTR|nr:hypothetical protein CIT292_08519 [Citrobacter youngae ATCC 29220]
MRIITFLLTEIAMPDARLPMRSAKLSVSNVRKTQKWISKA